MTKRSRRLRHLTALYLPRATLREIKYTIYKHVTSRRFTHGTVVESMADSARDEVHHLHACRVRCVRPCMDFTRSVENVEARRVRVDHDEAFETCS